MDRTVNRTMQSQLPQAWDQGDDWRGVTSSKERRRRQNRLHQRAHREKRRLQSFPPPNNGAKTDADAEATYAAGGKDDDAASRQITSARDARLMWPLLNPSFFPVFFKCFEAIGIDVQISQFLQGAYLRWSLNRPIPRDLPTVSRLNAFDALIRNAAILHIPVECLETEEASSPFIWREIGAETEIVIETETENEMEFGMNNHLVDHQHQQHQHQRQQQQQQQQHPPHLSPTWLQRAVAHHAWLDLFPFPALRNNMLQGIQSGAYDEDQLCGEFCCDLLNLEAQSAALVVVWGDSWDAGAWEFSPEVLRKWTPLFRGCDDLVRATNYWRRRRGEMEIDFVLNP